MIVSRLELAGLCLALAALGLGGCRTPAGPPMRSAFLGEPRFAPIVPDVADQTAAELARAALASNVDETSLALRRLEAIDTVLEAADEPSTGLIPVSTDLANATLDDSRAYRRAALELLGEDQVGPSLKKRLELFIEDDPLFLANARVRDARVLAFGRAFNALAEPIGKSIMTAQLAPYRLSRSVLNYALALIAEEPLNLQERQALAHWKEFLARHPEAPEAERLVPRVQDAQARWNRTYRDRSLRIAKQAFEAGQVRQTLVHADRALRFVPEDEKASELRDEAGVLLERQREADLWSLESPTTDSILPDGSRELALALLLPGGDVRGEAGAVLEADPHGPLADEARYALAMARGEDQDESAMWVGLKDLAGGDVVESNMARHADVAIHDPYQNPFRSFKRARWRDRFQRGLWVLLGPFAGGPRERGLPSPIEWGIDLPAMAQTAFSSPLRLAQLPWKKPPAAARTAARHAKLYLRRYPGGVHTEELSDWLVGYEAARENWRAALQLTLERPDPDPQRVAVLRERAARQSLDVAIRERRLDARHEMYRSIAREFPATSAGRRAGMLARDQLETTPQQIRISRGFLLENPRVAGTHGLGVRPELLDDDPTNGELHPEGITLIGARTVRVGYLDPGGDPKDPAVQVYEEISEEHLGRLVSQLEEVSYQNTLLDTDDSVAPDAHRDVFFERARLGLADSVDRRPAAGSSYTYLGIRERYGMVRARESILPFDIVVQGSLTELSLGAFPRMRPPRETPDAMLYR